MAEYTEKLPVTPIDGDLIELDRLTFEALLSNIFVAKYAVDKAMAGQYSAGERIKRTEKLQYERNILWEYARTGKLINQKW